MRAISFDPDSLTGAKKIEWDALTARAEEATQVVIQRWEDWIVQRDEWKADPDRPQAEPQFDPAFDDGLWKEIRDWLLENVFNNKCAYCESQILRFIGDSEHFRPKGRVSVADKKTKKNKIAHIVDESGNEVMHPGYFWLAYNWKNLLPACHICNRNGKRDLFPVKNHHVAVRSLTAKEVSELLFKQHKHLTDEFVFYMEPEDLDRYEGRLLLHPRFDTPTKYLTFGVDGSVEAINECEEGVESIATYRLKEEDLRKARNSSQTRVFRDYLNAIAYADGDLTAKKEASEKALAEYIDSGGPYVSAVVDYLHIHLRGSPYDPKP